jgi:hypothetical protein
MGLDGLRQSDRVSLRVPVEASWFAAGGMALKRNAHTLLVSRNGGVLRLPDKLPAGQELTLRRQEDGDNWKSTRARVVAEIDQEPEGYLYAFHILEARPDFWGIEFPALHQATEAVARLLMDCSFCQRREVVYLSPMELKSFEMRRCVARICGQCNAPSIWIEAQPQMEEALPEAAVVPVEHGIYPRRKKARIKARVLACIRRRGFEEEVAVCEDLSKGGLSFRSRNQYPEGTRIEVSVPFTPGSSAIFVPVRIVFSVAIPSAGLFKHGVSYIRDLTGPNS